MILYTLATTTRTGHTFAGWFTASSGGTYRPYKRNTVEHGNNITHYTHDGHLRPIRLIIMIGIIHYYIQNKYYMEMMQILQQIQRDWVMCFYIGVIIKI